MAAVSEHVTVKTEPPESDLGLTTRFERNAISLLEELYGGARRLTRNLAGAEDLVVCLANNQGLLGRIRV